MEQKRIDYDPPASSTSTKELRRFGRELGHEPVVAAIGRRWNFPDRYVAFNRLDNAPCGIQKVIHGKKYDDGLLAVDRSDDPHFFIGLKNKLHVSNMFGDGFHIYLL
jgi:hypothetical protein